MPSLTFDHLRWLNLLWAALGLAAVGLYGIWQRQRALHAFADLRLLARLTPLTGWLRPVARLVLIVLSLTALVGALIGPRWGEQTQQLLRRNMDVLVLLDVSRSMLARDIAPSRLERAKLAIRDDLLPALGGDRIGLIAFAGKPSVACPLTTDYGFFRLALADITTQSAPLGGTLIGDAIRKVGELFAKELETHKIILLITDGGDQGSLPVEAAAGVWQDQHIPIVAVALGDPDRGARIPVPGERGEAYLKYGGEDVVTKANFEELQQVASASPEGLFVAVGTRDFDLGEIYRRVAAAVRADEETQEQQVRQPSRYHPFAVVALLLVLLDSCLRDGPRRAAVPAARTANQQEEAA